MELDQYKVQIDSKLRILLVEHPTKSVTLDKLIEIKNLLEKSTNKVYNYGIIHRMPCYWFSYRLSDRKVIVCGVVNKTECVNETKIFAKN